MKLITDHRNKTNCLSFQCYFCFIPDIVYRVIAPSVLQLSAILVTGFLYCRVVITLKTVRSVDRSKLITKTFIFLWLFWTPTSVPYILFLATKELVFRKSDEFIEGSFYGVMVSLSVRVNLFGYYIFSTYDEELISLTNTKRLWFVEIGFRTLKVSFGFINSLLLIVLFKPFHEPIVKILKRFTLFKGQWTYPYSRKFPHSN